MVHMEKTNASTVEMKSEVAKDERAVIVLDKLLAALGYNETKTEQLEIPKAT